MWQVTAVADTSNIQPVIYLTDAQLARKSAYRIDPILARQVRRVEHNPRLNGEIYGTSLWKERARRAGVLIASTSLITFAPLADTAEAGGRCPQYEALMHAYAPRGGWSVNRMSAYAFRESRCIPTVRSRTRDTGLLQINDVNLPYLSKKLGFTVTVDSLKDPEINIRAAAKLCEFARRAWGNCYQPWRKR